MVGAGRLLLGREARDGALRGFLAKPTADLLQFVHEERLVCAQRLTGRASKEIADRRELIVGEFMRVGHCYGIQHLRHGIVQFLHEQIAEMFGVGLRDLAVLLNARHEERLQRVRHPVHDVAYPRKLDHLACGGEPRGVVRESRLHARRGPC